MSDLGFETRQGTGYVECMDMYQILPLGRKEEEEKEKMNLFTETTVINDLPYVRRHTLFYTHDLIYSSQEPVSDIYITYKKTLDSCRLER